MKGLKGFDPTQQPNDLVVLVAVIGWVFMLVAVISAVLDWIAS